MPSRRTLTADPDGVASIAAGGRPFPFRTASIAPFVDTTPGELHALGAHAATCRGSRGHWWRAAGAVDAVARFMAPRLVTSGVVVAVVFALGSLFA